MTSTTINIGHFDTKNTSRVIKPPGGGHTDIFGVHEELKTPSKKNGPTSSISSCFQMDKSEKTDELNKTENENKESTAETKKDEVEAPKPRSRIPPGGYSSGFW